MKLNLRKSTDALTPAFSAIMVTFIVTSTVGTVVFWGVPYVDTLNEKREQENVERQIDAVVDSIADLAGSRPGHTDTTYVATGGGGSISVDKDEDRLVLMYSYSNQYNFTANGLSLDAGHPERFTINLPNGLDYTICSRAVISWLDFDTCFLAGTKIVMADSSYKNIEDIKIGDIVKSYDTETKMLSDCRVTQIYHHTPEEMTEYYLVINDQLGVTPNHRFYSNHEWVYAGDLKVGDSLFCMEQNMVYSVYSIDRFYEQVSTFDLEVEHCHNYFVYMNEDAVEVLVHNGDDIGPGDDNPPAISWYPDNGSVGWGTSVTLQITAVDPDEKPLIVTFYNYSNGQPLPGGTIPINSGETASYTWSGLGYSKSYYWNITIFDGLNNFKYGYWKFTTNRPPQMIFGKDSPHPGNNSNNVDVPATLKVQVFDLDGDSITVRFYNYSNGNLLPGGQKTVSSGSLASYTWSSLGYSTSYKWNVTLWDGHHFVKSTWWNFTTKPQPNMPPNKPVNPTPFDGARDIVTGEILTLKVTVYDTEGDLMTVTFLDASSHTTIGKKYNVSNGEITADWKPLNYDKEYSWYVRVQDGKSQPITSDIWSFKTTKESDEIYSRAGNENWEIITTAKSLEGAVVIKLYNDDYTRFGKIFIFDSNSLTYNIRSNEGVENIILENGGIVYSSSDGTYVKNGLSAQETSGFLKLSVVQMVGASHSSASVSGMGNIRINTEFKGSVVTREDAKGEYVYHLKLQFSGDHKDIWSNYFNETYNFAIQSLTGEPDFLRYKTNGIKLMLWHSYIAFSLM